MDYIGNQRLQHSLSVFQLAAGLLAAMAIGVILYVGKDVIIQIALAVLLSFVLGPALTFVLRMGLPKSLAVTLVVTAAVGIIMGLIAIVTWQLAVFAEQIPVYQNTILRKVQALSTMVSGEGVFSRAAAVMERVVQSLAPATDAASQATRIVINTADTGPLSRLTVMWAVINPLLHPVATMFVVMLLTAFILMQREDLRNRFVKLMGTQDIQQTTFALDDAGQRLSGLLLSQLAINGAFGALIGVGLFFIGVPSAALWGIFAGIMRFVPYIGAVIGVVPPLLAAFAFDPGWSSVIWTGILFLTIEPLIGHVIEPWLVGRRVGLSPVAIVVSATIWAALWGPVGLVLATPMTVCILVIGRHFGRMAFVDTLLGDRPTLTPQEIFYQRMLAGDPREAIDNATAFLKRKSKVSFYDRIVLEAVRRGHLDLQRGKVTMAQRDMFITSLLALITALEKTQPFRILRRNRGAMARAEIEAAVELVQDASRTSLQNAMRASSQTLRIGLLHGDADMDAPVARMLSQLLRQSGHAVETKALSAQIKEPASSPELDMVFLCHIEPVSTLHLRIQVAAIRRCVGNIPVVLCIWQKSDPGLKSSLERRVRADHVASSLFEALAYVIRDGTASS